MCAVGVEIVVVDYLTVEILSTQRSTCSIVMHLLSGLRVARKPFKNFASVIILETYQKKIMPQEKLTNTIVITAG